MGGDLRERGWGRGGYGRRDTERRGAGRRREPLPRPQACLSRTASAGRWVLMALPGCPETSATLPPVFSPPQTLSDRSADHVCLAPLHHAVWTACACVIACMNARVCVIVCMTVCTW